VAVHVFGCIMLAAKMMEKVTAIKHKTSKNTQHNLAALFAEEISMFSHLIFEGLSTFVIILTIFPSR
jgi:hypothetical protein